MIAVDRDPRAIAEAHKIQDSRFQIEHNSFSHIPEICDKLNLVGKIDGILLDLGVSSPQLDEAERGFSFMKDGPLDMRMDTTQGLSAEEWLKQVSIEDLTWVLKTFGEERFAKRIATAIVDFNKSAVKIAQNFYRVPVNWRNLFHRQFLLKININILRRVVSKLFVFLLIRN